MGVREVMRLFPGGRTKALTLSYDDGVTQDRRLLEILNKYGIKATFNINSGFLGQEDSFVYEGKTIPHSHISEEEVKNLFKGHEIAIHTVTHPHLENLPRESVFYEVIEDRRRLEELAGYPVRGMAYPFGTYSNQVKSVLKELGVEYSRTVNSHGTFNLPEDYLEWNPTCHHNDGRLMELTGKFIGEKGGALSIFYLWGHSYEFEVDDNWNVIEDFCRLVWNNKDIWYATNIEIVDYLNALSLLKFSVSGLSVYNPSGRSVWLNIGGRTLEVCAGETIKI